MNIIKIMGKYYDTKYRDEDSGFTIFRLRPQLSVALSGKLRNGFITCKGLFSKLNSNVPMELAGCWESNSYGWTFQVAYYKEKSWDEMVTFDFIRSIKGVSEKNALIISKAYDDFFEEIRTPGSAMTIAMLTNMTVDKAQHIVDAVVAQSAKRETMEFLFEHSGRMKNVDRLFTTYGVEGVKKLKESPYEIGEQIGLPLEGCDSIAMQMQYRMDSPKRITAYVSKYLQRAMMSGHMYVRERTLLPDIMKKLNSSSNNVSESLILSCLRTSNFLTVAADWECNKIYLRYLKKAEDNLAEQVLRLQASSVKTNYSDSYLEYAESIAGFQFAPEQRSAFNLLKRTGIGILTGGPGTGKTTTVKGIIDAFEKMYPNKKIKLCAPTGRAAQRMTESTGRSSTTIHRLLEYKPFEGDTDEIQCKNEYDPIDADLIVVDEVSMLDCQLASLFFTAVKAGTLVLMVGDVNQLQSVGAGDVLNDLINSGRIPVERLVKTYRQAEDSSIIKNAFEINIGHEILYTADDFEIYQTQNITEKILEIIERYHKKDDLFYAQVLSPTHKGDGGVADINYKLQEKLNPGDVPYLVYGKSHKFKLYDKIIMTKNNLEKGYFNGDVGYIIEVGKESLKVKIQDQTIELNHANLDDVKLAYSMTIHKSQGSEFPVVIISLPNSGILKRNLLYTAVTRAKKKVIIVQQTGAIAIAVHRNEVGKRNTALIETMNERDRRKPLED